MVRKSIGVVQGRSGRIDDLSLRNKVVDEEPPELPNNDPETQVEPAQPIARPNSNKSTRRKKKNDRDPINYFGALDATAIRISWPRCSGSGRSIHPYLRTFGYGSSYS